MSLAHEISQPAYDPGHLKDVQDLFAGIGGGQYIRHAFVTEEQLARWSDYMQWAFYYASRNEPPLIPIAADQTAKLIRCPHSVVGVENGPGTVSGVELKTIAYYSRIPGMHTLVGRDWSEGVGEAFHKVVGNKIPEVRRIFDLSNFNRDPLPRDIPRGQKIFAEFGFSRGNLEGNHQDGYPMHLLEADADHLVSLMSEGDTYAMTIDANPFEEDILRCYSPPVNNEWGRSQIRHMKSTLPITGDFFAEDFITRPIWYANSWLCTNNLIPTRTMHFNVGGLDRTAYKGQPYPFTNMWKVPLDPIVSVYEERGLKLKATPRDANKWVHIPVFQM